MTRLEQTRLEIKKGKARTRKAALAARVKQFMAAGTITKGEAFAWAYCTCLAWVDRVAVGYVQAINYGEAKAKARKHTDYFKGYGVEGHPGVHVWPDPLLTCAQVGPRFRFEGRRVRFATFENKAAREFSGRGRQ